LPVVSCFFREKHSNPSHGSVHRFRALAILHECLDAVRAAGCKGSGRGALRVNIALCGAAQRLAERVTSTDPTIRAIQGRKAQLEVPKRAQPVSFLRRRRT
jgi:hypothetical protein